MPITERFTSVQYTLITVFPECSIYITYIPISPLAVRYQENKERLLVSSCATILPGPAKYKIFLKTGLKKVIPGSKVFHDYFNNAGSIDVYIHIRTGSVGLEDTWRTHFSKTVHFAGLLGFVEANAFLAKSHFCCVESFYRNCHNTYHRNLSKELLYNTSYLITPS